MFSKRDIKRRLLKTNREDTPLWPLWVRILLGIGVLTFIGRVAWIIYMG
jgi:hypothetical protein